MIRFVAALMAEATPIVDRFRMARQEGSLPYFSSDHASLVVSGIGKRAAAAATGYLHARTEGRPSGAWLNVGIAGHRTLPTGTLVLAHTIRDQATGRRWFPPQLLDGPDRAEVLTVERPESGFESDAVYDMEASAFYPTASSFATGELVQCVKTVSDNLESPARDLTEARIRELVTSQLDTIETIVDELRSLAKENESARLDLDVIDAFMARWRFSVTERRRLERLLIRWRALAPDDNCDPDRLRQARNGVHALSLLEARLRELSVERELY